jgi:hypothetical protein
MADPNAEYPATPSSFGRKSRIVTPGATDLDPIAKAVVCLTAGDITVVPVNNDNAVTITFAGVPAGYVVPFQVRRVTAATATVATIED